MAAAKENIVIDVTVDTGDATKSISGIENRIEELTSQRNELQIGTEAFEKVSREMQGLESQIKNVDLQFEALDFEQKMTAGTDAVVGLAGGFMAAQGAAHLMGIESDSLEKGLMQMAAAMSISMGLRDLANGVIALRKFGLAQKAATVATRIFNAAIKANPIGAIIVGITALIGVVAILIHAFKEFGAAQKTFGEQQLEAMQRVEDQMKRNIELAQKQNEIAAVTTSTFEAQANATLRAAKLKGKTGQDLLDIEKSIADQRAKNTKAEFELANTEAFASQEKIKRLERELMQENQNLLIRDSKWDIHIDAVKQHDERVKMLEDEGLAFAKATADREFLQVKAVNDSKESRMLQAEFNDKIAKEQSAKRKTRRDERAARTSQQLQSEEAELNAFYQAIEQTETAHFNSFLSDQEKEEQAVKDKFFELITLAEKYGEDTALLEEARQKELRKIRQKYGAQERIEAGEKAIEIQKLLEDAKIQNIADENERAKAERQKEFDDETLALMEEGMLTHDLEIELKKKLDADLAELDIAAKEAQKQRTIETINAGFQSAQNSVNALSALNEAALARQLKGLSANDKRREQIERKAFERGKKIQIAQAIISGLQGVVNIWSATSTIPQPYDAILRAINTAALIATTAAQISKIKSTPFAGGGSVSGGGAGASAGAGGVPINNISNTASLVDQQQQEITAKVVVVESDITTTQENVATVSEVSTF